MRTEDVLFGADDVGVLFVFSLCVFGFVFVRMYVECT